MSCLSKRLRSIEGKKKNLSSFLSLSLSLSPVSPLTLELLQLLGRLGDHGGLLGLSFFYWNEWEERREVRERKGKKKAIDVSIGSRLWKGKGSSCFCFTSTLISFDATRARSEEREAAPDAICLQKESAVEGEERR